MEESTFDHDSIYKKIQLDFSLQKLIVYNSVLISEYVELFFMHMKLFCIYLCLSRDSADNTD